MAVTTYAVDRIEGGFAVCECLQTGARITLDVKMLPKGLKEGDILREREGGYLIDEAGTRERAQDLAERVRKLFEKHRQ